MLIFGLEIGLEPVGLLMGIFEPEKYTQMYNCNVYNVEDIPLENRQSIPLGMMFFTLGMVCEILYIPCMIAIRKHMDNTCFQLMFYIAVADMLALSICGVLTGYLAMIGAVYCSYPKFIFFMGSWAVCLWIAESTAEIVLAFNRCVELSSSYWADVLFHGKCIYLWMMIPTIYGLYALLFIPPGQFSGLFIAWFFNPHVGYINDFDKYHSVVHTVHNYIVVVGLSGIYLTTAFIMKMTTAAHGISRSQKNTLIQLVLISLINAISAFLFVYMQFTRVTPFISIVAQFLWALAHGIPPFIYLLFNKTVRHDVYKMVLSAMSKGMRCAKLDIVGTNTTRVSPTLP